MKQFIKQYLILILSIISVPLYAKCVTNEINLGGFSYHFTKESDYAKKNGYNQDNWSIGYTCNLEKISLFNDRYSFNSGLEVGVVKNSFRENAYYVAYDLFLPIDETFSIGVRNIIATNYAKTKINNSGINNSGIVFGPLPTLKVKMTDMVDVNFSILPSVKSDNFILDGFIFMNVGIKF